MAQIPTMPQGGQVVMVSKIFLVAKIWNFLVFMPLEKPEHRFLDRVIDTLIWKPICTKQKAVLGLVGYKYDFKCEDWKINGVSN